MVRACLLWAMAAQGFSQSRDFPRGSIIEKVPCLNNAAQTYALYLPAEYSPDRKWPIIYALDSGARGSLPVRRFKLAADRYGYIVAGSNNSRNGPMAVAEEAVNAMFRDTNSRYSVDNRRVYLAGFSGGARVAVAAAAAMQGQVAGVIGCGAGFHPGTPLSAAGFFSYLGIIGIEDFNFPEMRALDAALEKLKTIHRLDIFKGGHDWPPETACTRAIEWMELQAMKTGLRNRDEDWIDTIFSRAAEEAQAYERSRDIYDAYQAYAALARDFAQLKDTRALQTKIRVMQNSREYKKAVQRENEMFQQQERLDSEIGGLLESIASGQNRAFRIQELHRRFGDLYEEANQTKDQAGRMVATRILASFWIRLNESAEADLESKRYDLAALKLELMARIRPDNPLVYYYLSRAYARNGKTRDALKALRNAVAKGFKNAAELESNADFEALRLDPAFKDIVAGLKKAP